MSWAMPVIKWKTFSDINPEQKYLAMALALPLNKHRMIPRVLPLTGATQKQLSEARGLVGYSLRVQFLRRTFWSMSVWEDRTALYEFAQKEPHN